MLRASFWFVICSFMQKGINVITTPIFTRLMSTAEYGQYNVFNSWYRIIEVFVSLELSKGVYSQGIVKYSSDRQKFSSSFQGLNITFLAVWTGIYLLFHGLVNRLLDLTTVQMLCMLAMIWATAAFELWVTEKRTDLSYRALVGITLLTSILKPLVGILFVVKASDKVTARILGLALVEVMVYTGLCISQLKRGKTFFSKKYWVYAIVFNVPLIPHYLSQIVLASSDRIMIKSMVSDAAAGIYSLGYSISLLVSFVGTALHNTVNPWIYKKIKAGDMSNLQSLAYVLFSFYGFANVILIALAPELVHIFAPDSFRDSVWVVPPVTLSEFFMFMYTFFACFEFYFEERKFCSFASSIGALLNIILNALMIPSFGYLAAAYTTLLCNILYVTAHFLFMQRVCRKHMNGIKVYNGTKLVKLSILVTLVSVLYSLLYFNVMIRYACLLAMGTAACVTRKKWLPELLKIFRVIRE